MIREAEVSAEDYRKMIIRILRKMPEDYKEWDHTDTVRFKIRVEDALRTATLKNASKEKLKESLRQILSYYDGKKKP